MVTIDELLTRASALSQRSGWALTTVSHKLFGDGTRLGALASGKDMGVRRLQRAIPVLEDLESQFPVPAQPETLPHNAAQEASAGVRTHAPADADSAADVAPDQAMAQASHGAADIITAIDGVFCGGAE